MDKAYADFCCADYTRADVYFPLFDEITEQLENTPAKSMGGTDPYIAGHYRAGKVRAGVYLPYFDEVIEQLEKIPSNHKVVVM